jgi:hypothetical protein
VHDLIIYHSQTCRELAVFPSGKTKLTEFVGNRITISDYIRIYVYSEILSIYEGSNHFITVELPYDNNELHPSLSGEDVLDALSELYELLHTQFYL